MNGGWIVLFDSIHHVLAAEKDLAAAGVASDLIPVPRQLRSDCGMALAIAPTDWPAAEPVLAAATARRYHAVRA